MAELVVNSEDKYLDTVLDFIHTQTEKFNVDPKMIMQMDLAVEEIFVNIAHYAYQPGSGDIKVICEAGEDSGNPVVKIEFSDQGIAFDPLAKEDPDVTLSVEERGIGGLGIFLVKKYMDFVSYERNGNVNVFTMTKKLV